jgi:serine/threonine-protein kinase RsbW
MANGRKFTLSMSAPPDDVDTVHALLESVWAHASTVPTTDRVSFATALIELTGNVIRHADAGLGVTCTLTIEIFDDRLEARLSDSGEPGGVQLASRDMPDDLAESGRGVPLIEALVDELHYERSESSNHWWISRKLDQA